MDGRVREEYLPGSVLARLWIAAGFPVPIRRPWSWTILGAAKDDIYAFHEQSRRDDAVADYFETAGMEER